MGYGVREGDKRENRKKGESHRVLVAAVISTVARTETEGIGWT